MRAGADGVRHVFKTLDLCSGPRGFVGDNPPQGLADRMHRIWVDFARDGTAPWPEYDPSGRQIFALERDEVVTDAPLPAERLGH